MGSSSCGPETKSSSTDPHVNGFLFRKTQLSRQTNRLKCGGFPCVGKIYHKETESKMEQRRKRNRSDEEKA